MRVLLVSALVRETSMKRVLLALTLTCIVYAIVSWSGIHLTALIFALTRSDYFLLVVVVFGSPALGYAINRAGFLNKRRQIPPHDTHD